MAIKEDRPTVNGDKPKKRLILNAFVEMCTLSNVSGNTDV